MSPLPRSFMRLPLISHPSDLFKILEKGNRKVPSTPWLVSPLLGGPLQNGVCSLRCFATYDGIYTAERRLDNLEHITRNIRVLLNRKRRRNVAIEGELFWPREKQHDPLGAHTRFHLVDVVSSSSSNASSFTAEKRFDFLWDFMYGEKRFHHCFLSVAMEVRSVEDWSHMLATIDGKESSKRKSHRPKYELLRVCRADSVYVEEEEEQQQQQQHDAHEEVGFCYSLRQQSSGPIQLLYQDQR